MSSIKTDMLIIGAGPVGLFTVFEAGLHKMKCHIMDVLPHIGGQLTEIYPKKPIYDIPGLPEVLAGDLIENLRKQIVSGKATARRRGQNNIETSEEHTDMLAS